MQPFLQWKSNEYYITCVCVCVCVFIALGIQHAMLVLLIVTCSLPRYTIFLELSHKTARFLKSEVIEYKIVLRLLLQILSEKFSF